jgi:hypothetical protein
VDSRLTIACVYRPGGDFFAEYVYRLQRNLADHVKIPYEFVCLSLQDLRGVNTIRLKRDLPGWWSKLELFGHKYPGPVWYFDLDTIIIRDITDMVQTPFEFAALGPFKNPDGHVLMGEDTMGSGVMAFDGTLDWSRIPNAYTPRTQYEYRTRRRWGDQGFIQDQLSLPFEPLQAHFPGRIVRFKSDIRRADKTLAPPPRDASIVCFSGKPRPHEINWSLPS